MNNKITWFEITEIEQLHKIKNQWQALNLTQSAFQIFNSPIWIFSWLNTFWQNNWHLKVLTAWDNEKLVAIAPLYYQQESIFSVKTLYPLGQGETEAQEISSEYVDILIQTNIDIEVQSDIKTKIQQWIQDLRADQFIWRALSDKSIAGEVIENINKPNKTNTAARYIVNCPSWSLDTLSKNMRSRYRRGLNQLNNLDAKIAWVRKEDFEQYWQIMKEFHQQRWLGKNKKGAFYSDEFNKFHSTFREKSPENVAMSAVWINDTPVALHYYFSDATTLYFYQSGWNESEYSHLSPGLILHLWSIENNNKAYYDFMMGKKQDSYKAKFATQQQPMYHIKTTFSPIKLMIYRVLNKIKLIK